MKIKNVRVYGLSESINRSGYPMTVGEPDDMDNFALCHPNDANRALKLSKTPSGSGHDNFLKGIIVQFDLQYTQYWTKQIQRYNWFDYFSGQSQMHKMTVRPLKEACNKYVCQYIIDVVQFLIDKYNSNETTYPFTYDDIDIESKDVLFEVIMSNCPMGYQLWQPVTTNYMQLKTMYKQRKSHKLSEWREFCKWIETLPMSELITG